jgi:hypothetical protein
MVKTSTSTLTSENLSKNEKLSKRKLNDSVCEPSDETIQNILNYSKALNVQHSEKTGVVSNVMN